MEIEVSAPFASRVMISPIEYFRFPESNSPSTPFRLSWPALSCCLWVSLISGFFVGLPNLFPDGRMFFLLQKFLFLVLM